MPQGVASFCLRMEEMLSKNEKEADAYGTPGGGEGPLRHGPSGGVMITVML